jgi:hypothetical protein
MSETPETTAVAVLAVKEQGLEELVALTRRPTRRMVVTGVDQAVDQQQ